MKRNHGRMVDFKIKKIIPFQVTFFLFIKVGLRENHPTKSPHALENRLTDDGKSGQNSPQ